METSMRRQPFSIVLIGPHALLLEGLTHILCGAHFRVVASVTCLSDLAPDAFQPNDRDLSHLESSDDLDIALPQIQLFKEQHPNGRVGVLGNRNRPADMVAAFRAGANVHFDIEERCDAFIKALELVMLGETILPPELLFYFRYPQGEEASPKVDRHLPEPTAKMSQLAELEWPQLSFRENCILRCIIEGCFKQSHSAKDRHCGSDRKGSRQSDLTQAPGSQPDAGRDLGHEARWQISHDGYNPAKGSAQLLASSPDTPVQTLAGRKTESGAKAVTIADGSPFISPGLDANRSCDGR